MQQNQDIQRKVEETLESLGGIQPASAQPWFYSRLMARMNKENTSVWGRIGSFLARPVIAVGSVCMILALNVFFLVSEPEEADDVKVVQSDSVTESESIIASTSSYEYENLVQP